MRIHGNYSVAGWGWKKYSENKTPVICQCRLFDAKEKSRLLVYYPLQNKYRTSIQSKRKFLSVSKVICSVEQGHRKTLYVLKESFRSYIFIFFWQIQVCEEV